MHRKISLGMDLIGLRSSEADLQSLKQKERMCKKYDLGVVEAEVHVVFGCPIYETLRVKYSELFRDATNLNGTGAFSSATCHAMPVDE
jgi:hypothetical protein